MEKHIPLSVPNLKGGNERKYVDQAISEEWVSTGGRYIGEFEKAIAAYVGVDDAVACQNGTAGLHLALIAAGVKPGDAVIVPTLTFIAAVNPVSYIGASPIFMDCDDSLCIAPEKVQSFCEQECNFDGEHLMHTATDKPITALMCVHVFGNLANLEALMDISKRYNLALIEDATEALGSRYEQGRYAGRFAGTIGDIGVYSFNGNKIITTGGGGMIVSRHDSYLERCRHLSTQAKVDTLYFIHDEIGYNYRMTNLQAAMGIAQLERLEDFITIKKRNYNIYKEAGIDLIPFKNGTRPNYWFYSYMTEKRDEVINYLKSANIDTRPVWKLIHTLSPYKDAYAYKIEKAVYYWEHIVNLPCSTNLTEEDVEVVTNQICNFKQYE